MRSHFPAMIAALVWALAPGEPAARAQPANQPDEAFAYHAAGDVTLDAGLFVGSPSALPAGMSTGVSAGFLRGCDCMFAYGARASWSSEAGSSLVWTVTQWDLRLRASGALRKRVGRGELMLRADAGATMVHEARLRNQSMEASLTGGALDTRALALLPAGEFQAVVGLHVAGPWVAIVSAGPSMVIDSGHVHGGFVTELGVAWQP